MLNKPDHKLSMLISPRARRATHNLDLRTLLVHRLVDSYKAVLRRSNTRQDRVAILCEPCEKWVPANGRADLPSEWECPHCARTFRIECAIYGEVEEVDETKEILEDDDADDIDTAR